MARLTEGGMIGTTLTEYQQLLGNRMRAVFGQQLSLEPETPQGQLIGVLSLTLAEQDEALVALANATSIRHAEGRQLDDIAGIFGITRISSTPTTATAVLTGTPQTLIPQATLMATGEGELYELVNAVTIGSDGNVTAAVQSIRYGPIALSQNALATRAYGGNGSTIDRVAGWDGIRSSTTTEVGHNRETDSELRARYRERLGRNARGPRDSIHAAVASVVPPLDRYSVLENATASPATVDGESIAAHSFVVLTESGITSTQQDAVDAAIESRRPVGITGTRRAANPVTLHITVSTTRNNNFPSDGATQIADAVTAWVNALSFSEALTAARLNELYGVLYGVAGHVVAPTTQPAGAQAGRPARIRLGSSTDPDLAANGEPTGISGAYYWTITNANVALEIS